MAIANAVGIPFNTPFDFSAWWAIRYVSGCSVDVISDTFFEISWTNNGPEDYTGHKVYISTNDITYILWKTIASIGTLTTINDLQRGTTYYVKIAPYKNDNIGNLCDAVSETTYAWLDDFESNTNAYFSLGAEVVVINQILAWNPNGTHTATVVEANLGGFQYWMWWCCPDFEGIGLARSNALDSGWVQYAGNPVLANMRSANAYIEGGLISIFYDVSPSVDTYVVRVTTSDGLTLSAPVTYVAQEVGYFNTDSFFFKDPNTNLYHLYWNRYDAAKTIRQIWCKTATSITGLITAVPTLVIDETNPNVKAQYFIGFSVVYTAGKYWLTFETSFDWIAGHTWAIFAFFSNNPLTGWQLSGDSPFLKDGRACPVQHLFGTQLYLYISYLVASPDWDTRLIISNLTKNVGVQWIKSLAGANATIDYSTDQKINGTKSIKLYSGTTAGTTYIQKYFRASYNKIKYSKYIIGTTELTGGYNTIIDIYLTGTRVLSCGFAAGTSANWRYHNGTGWVNSTTAVTIGWHNIEISFGVGGVSLTIDSNVINANIRTQVQWDEIRFTAGYGGANKYTTIYVDDLIVEKV